MYLIKSALLLILFACPPFSTPAIPVTIAKGPLAATTSAATVLPGGQININTVDEVALVRGLSGIDEFRVKAILEYRVAHDLFAPVGQLLEVKGVDLTLLGENRSRIVVE